ncbi:hypothetical protein [Rubellimicrobium roseum]|uniref:DUF1311 domain-containing protein n=1 Tax=Rubellimicrobium roseum TaxID=687525 RepID=A0A5C4N8Q9_9RHOB|nr:hypothetical protein [Rubellimicrobium roseum]TNC65967.1 hypothetical protein FHG71_17005 [Rubellimicrobium roseum]
MRRATLSVLLPLALWPATGLAQEGPSFDCRDAGTRTEIAICADPGLVRLERRMYDAYLDLVERIGAREARRIADELLIRRQACEGDTDCIAERLLVSTEVFDQRGRSATELAGLAEPEVTPAAEPPDLPLAAQAPLSLDAAAPPESAPVPPLRPRRDRDLARVEIAPGDLDAAIAGAELASSDAAGEGASPDAMAPFDTPLSWAFMDLEREARADLQRNLQEAGLLDGPAEGTWTRGTLTAIEAFLTTPEGQSFDATTASGAALALDFLGSDAFAAARGEALGAEPDPLASTEW